jgi:hypothetical protein
VSDEPRLGALARVSIVVRFAGVIVLVSAGVVSSAGLGSPQSHDVAVQPLWQFSQSERDRLTSTYSLHPRSTAAHSPISHVLLAVAPIPTRSMPHPGTPLVSWSTGNGSPGRVTVTEGDSPERLFAIASAGTAGAPWIQADRSYVFRLYSIGGRLRLLATFHVRGRSSSSEIVAVPPTARGTPAEMNRVLQLAPFVVAAWLCVLLALHVRTKRDA